MIRTIRRTVVGAVYAASGLAIGASALVLGNIEPLGSADTATKGGVVMAGVIGIVVVVLLTIIWLRSILRGNRR
jgi:hypothetical protein